MVVMAELVSVQSLCSTGQWGYVYRFCAAGGESFEGLCLGNTNIPAPRIPAAVIQSWPPVLLW